MKRGPLSESGARRLIQRSLYYFRHGTYKSFAILTVASFLLALPTLLYGPMAAGHDSHEHLNYTRHFAEQFWDGDLFPRWLLNMNHGLGSPTFFVFPPLPSYIYSILVPAGKALHFNAFNVMAFLALLVSGLSAFLWIRQIAIQRVALASAILYLLIPYHLAVDFYQRVALPECWGLAWMPLALFFTIETIRRKSGAVVGLAVVYCLLILSHLVTVAIFSVIPLLVAVILSAPGHRLRSVFSVAAGMLLGTGLSCFYFVPALFHSRYFPVSRQGIVLPENLLKLWMLRYAPSHPTDFITNLYLTVAMTTIFVGFCGALAYRRGSSAQRKQVAFWLAVSALSFFMMSRFSILLWEKVPFLFDAVQFPWRFNILLCIAALPITAVFLSQLSWPLTFSQTSSLALVVLLVVPWCISYNAVLKDHDIRFVPPDPVSESDGWFRSWRTPGTDSTSAFQASLGPRARFMSGQGIARVLIWRPRRIEVETCSGTGGLVMINQFYYPEWKARVVGGSSSVEVKAAMPQGLLEVQVPPGRQMTRIEISAGFAERLGRWLSGFCALLSVLILVDTCTSIRIKEND